MKRVKFNVTTGVHMIPDENLHEYQNEMKKLRRSSIKSFAERIIGGSDYETIDVKIGDIVDVPNHYYERKKSTVVNVGNSCDNYTNKAGERTPFAHSDAVKHGHVKHIGETIKSIPLFELIEDLDTKSVAKANKNA